ncbi:MAG: ribonuclease P [Candidatus Aenigmarchaeota archaeon]|nr:ribonuclease P [Candidatus Aenigmarchaeota archaeon]
MKDRPKTLPSSYREKRRYLTFKIISDEEIRPEDLAKALWRAVAGNMGVFGLAKTNFHFFRDLYEQSEKKFVVRCMPKDVEAVRLSMALITEINEKPASIVSVGVSGTMRSSKKKHLKQTLLSTYKI